MPTPGTPRSSYRLGPDALADLDWIAAYLSAQTASPSDRTAAIRYAAKETRRRLGGGQKKPEKTNKVS